MHWFFDNELPSTKSTGQGCGQAVDSGWTRGDKIGTASLKGVEDKGLSFSKVEIVSALVETMSAVFVAKKPPDDKKSP